MNRNKIIFATVLVLLVAFFMVTTCYRTKNKSAILPPGTHGVCITEIVQTSNYSYLQVDENGKKFWIAIVRVEAKPGDSIYYTRASEMTNFVSKELGRTFPSVFFVDDPSNKLPQIAKPGPQQPLTPQKVAIKRWTDVSVTSPKGGITIADLYKKPNQYAGKMVIIRGVVVRFNSQIMNKNWVHLQDGTDFSDKFDVTITTMDSLAVGSTATFKGIVALNKDFGSGYTYDVIVEQAKASEIN